MCSIPKRHQILPTEYYERDLQNIMLEKDAGPWRAGWDRPPNPIEDDLRARYQSTKLPLERISVLEDWARYLRDDIASMNETEKRHYQELAQSYIAIAEAEIVNEERRMRLVRESGAPASTNIPPVHWSGTLVDLVIVMDCLKSAGLIVDAPDNLIVKHFQYESEAKDPEGNYRKTRTRIKNGGAYPSDKVTRLLEALRKAVGEP